MLNVFFFQLLNCEDLLLFFILMNLNVNLVYIFGIVCILDLFIDILHFILALYIFAVLLLLLLLLLLPQLWTAKQQFPPG